MTTRQRPSQIFLTMTNSSGPVNAEMMIKICGMRDPDNIHDVAALCPMLMGFIFHRASPRDATGLDPEVIKTLPPFIRPVCVTVNKDFETVMELCSTYGFRIIQLHGSEPPELCRRYKDQELIVLKAIGINDEFDWTSLENYSGAVDMFLFDTKTTYHGGSGLKFDWKVLNNYKLDIPYLLSGGIGPDDADNIVASLRPGMMGIDINSRFESEPGIKNIKNLIHLIIALRKYNEYEPDRKPFWEKE